MSVGDDQLNLGDRIRAKRTGKGLTLSQVADRAGLSIPYVSNLERGRGNPTLEALRSIAGALDVPVAELLAGDADSIDPLELVLADAPASLTSFARSERFKNALRSMSESAGVEQDEMRRRLLIGMASAPRRSTGEPTEVDWRRLLDVYRTILNEE